MHSRLAAVPTLLVLLLATSSAQSLHDKAYWRAIGANKFAVPAGASLPTLVAELDGYLGSPDPELRDDIAYSTLAAWIYRQKVVPIELRRSLLVAWSANLTRDIGDRGTDSVFRRSFSVLALGVLAITDNEAPFLEKAEFDRLLAAGIAYLRDERDLRGFDPAKGWVHSVAHTADLLKFLARSRHLHSSQQGLMLRAIAGKLGAADEVLIHGEDERLARAVLSVAARPDFDEAAFRAGVSLLAPPRPPGPPTVATLTTSQNRKNLVVALYIVLSTDARDLPTLRAARDIVLAALKAGMSKGPGRSGAGSPTHS